MTDRPAGPDPGKKSTPGKSSPTSLRARARLRAAEAAAEARRRAERIEELLADFFAAEEKGQASVQAAAERRDEQIAAAEKRLKDAVRRANERFGRAEAKHFAPQRRVLAELRSELDLSEAEIAEMTGLKPTEVRKHVKSAQVPEPSDDQNSKHDIEERPALTAKNAPASAGAVAFDASPGDEHSSTTEPVAEPSTAASVTS